MQAVFKVCLLLYLFGSTGTTPSSLKSIDEGYLNWVRRMGSGSESSFCGSLFKKAKNGRKSCLRLRVSKKPRSGGFASVGAALRSVPIVNTCRVVISISAGTYSSSSTMGLSPLLQKARELWKEWGMRLLVLLSLFLQLILATQARRRRFLFRYWIHVIVWTTYLLADSVATLTLSILSSRLANIQETKGMMDPKSQITAFWASFLLLHLGGPDMITAYVQKDNDLWLRQLARLCINVGLAWSIYFMALSGSTLSMLAAGMILVGFMKYAERILCLYLASKSRLRDSMLFLPNIVSKPRPTEQHPLEEGEGHCVKIEEGTEDSAPDDLPVNSGQASNEEVPVNSGQASNEEDAMTVVKVSELFKIFKPLFLGLIRRFGDLEVSKRIFMDSKMDARMAFRIMEIELGFMYDLLFTKAPLLNRAWGIIRWIISLSVPCAVLVFFSLQDKKDYAKVDVCITFLLVSVAILLEIYSLLLAISSYWVSHWRLQRFGKSALPSAKAFLLFCLNKIWPDYLTKKKEVEGWSNSVAQFSLLGLAIRKINRIFLKYPWLAKLDKKLVISDIGYKLFKHNMEEWIFYHIRYMVEDREWNNRLKNWVASHKLEACEVLEGLNCDQLKWSVETKEFDKSILIWHIATELCHYRDHDERQGKSPTAITSYQMSKLVSRYMLYLILLHPSMLPTGIGVLRYKDTSVNAQKFFEGKQAEMSRDEGNVSSVVIKWVRKLFKKERHFHTGVQSCDKGHKSRESRDLCESCHILLQAGTQLPTKESRSVLFDACCLASQLNGIASPNFGKKWELIGNVWAKLLIYAACQCKGHEHCESLSRGGELLSLIWLLMAHLGIAEAVETSEPE